MTSRLFTLHESHWDSYGRWNHVCGHTPVLSEKHSFILIVWDSKLDRVGQLPQMSTYSKGLKPLLREQNNEWDGSQQSIYCAKIKTQNPHCVPKYSKWNSIASMGLYSNAEKKTEQCDAYIH